MCCWLEQLPPELGVQLVWAARAEDRDALLEVLGCEIVRGWYLRDLRRYYYSPALVRAIRILGRRGRTFFPERMGPCASLGDTSQICHNETNNPSTIIVSRAFDTWHGAIVFGKNIQWIEVVIGIQPVRGTRTYYKNPRAENSVVVYDFPEFVDDFRGLPLVALQYNCVLLRCNPTGEITHMISTGDFYQGPERDKMATSEYVGFKGRIKLYLRYGVGFTV